jgi:hypothetical protein
MANLYITNIEDKIIVEINNKVIAGDGGSKNYDDLFTDSKGFTAVGILHYTKSGLKGLYEEMGDVIVQKYFLDSNFNTVNKLIEFTKRINGKEIKNTNWKKGMEAFLSSADSEPIQNRELASRFKRYLREVPDNINWSTEREIASLMIWVTSAPACVTKIGNQYNWDNEEMIRAYCEGECRGIAGSSTCRSRCNHINTHYPASSSKKGYVWKGCSRHSSPKLTNEPLSKVYAPLLQHIRSVESYNYSSIAGADSKVDPNPSGDLTKKTIGEIDKDKNIKSPKKDISERNTAVGAYQILKKYLIPSYAKNANLTENDLFSKENQDKMAIAAIERKIKNFRLKKDNDLQKASEGLCKIWAGLRCIYPIKQGRDGKNPKRDIVKGMSYYAGVSINAVDSKPSRADKLQSILSMINSSSPQPSSTNGILPANTPPIIPSAPVLPTFTDQELPASLASIESPFTTSSAIPEDQYLQFIQN